MIQPKTIRRWLPLALLILLAMLAWRTANSEDTDDARTEPVRYEEQLVSPLLSARRVPQALQAPLAFDAIQPAIETILRSSTPDTCLIVSIDGRILGQQNPEQGLIPASNQKIITTYAVLQTLGAEARFLTRVESPTPLVGGVIDGNLYLIGGGDPFLTTDDWWTQYEDNNGRAHSRLESLADAVVAAGVTEVTGTIIGDESYFDQARTGQWAQRLIDSNQSGPLSALAVNQGFAQWPTTYTGSSRPRVPAPEPALDAAQVFASLLSDRGVATNGVGIGVAPVGGTPIASIESPPLADIITHVNSYSDNFGAELLLKHVGREVNGAGTSEAGANAVVAFLEQKGLPTTGLNFVDGSGLAETNIVTCNLLAAILTDAGTAGAFVKTLSIGGERGSLIGRHVDTAAEGKIVAKTGTLNGVTALSGYAFSAVEEDTALVFSYIVNGELAGEDEAIRRLQEPFAEQLVLYPQAPSTKLLEPLPTTPIPQAPIAQDE